MRTKKRGKRIAQTMIATIRKLNKTFVSLFLD